jgi:hypothetical protein
MSFAGDLWTSVNRFASQAKMNLKNILVGTGDQILSKSSGQLIPGMLASVTQDSTGGSLKKGNVVQWDGSGWHTPEGTAHTHTSTADGGLFTNILLKAIENTWFANFPCVTKSMFYQSGTGGTYTDTISGTDVFVTINSGDTNTNSGNLRYGGFIHSFAYPSAFVTRIQLANSTTSSTARCGMNMEVANDVTNNKVKYGFEGCSGCNETKVSIISSDGTLRTKNTQSADDYSAIANYIMKLDPGVNVKYRKETGAIITKTNNIPSGGVSDRANSWVCGIQTTTAAAKTLNLYAFEAIGTNGGTMPIL